MSIKGHPSFLGPTGKFSRGRIAEDDGGELRFAVVASPGVVRIDFGTDVTWIGLTPGQARGLAEAILVSAEEADNAKPE